MPRDKLSISKIQKLTAPGRTADGDGLYLWVRPASKGIRRSWVFRYRFADKRHDLGLGGYPEVSLHDARSKRDELRGYLRDGLDPKSALAEATRDAEREIATRQAIPTFAEMAQSAYDALKTGLKKTDEEGGRWMSPLRIHVIPKIGHVRITDLSQHDVAETLRPIWHSKAETAEKALNRISLTVKHALAAGFDVRTSITADARVLLGPQCRKVQHIPALAWQDCPRFYQGLPEFNVAARALKLLMLTGVRTSELRFAVRQEFDLDRAIWTIPAERLKTYRPHRDDNPDFRVPLSTEAIRLIKVCFAAAGNAYLLLPSSRKKGPLSDMAMSKIMRDRGMEARPHGCRSSLRVFITEQLPEVSYEVAERVLNHKTGNEVAASYNRTDLLDLRAPIMEAWAAHLLQPVEAEI